MLPQWVCIMLAGGLGALSRWGVSTLLSGAAVSQVLLGTLVANTLGCFLFGLIWTWLLYSDVSVSTFWKPVLLVGFLGALTTFSSYVMEGFLQADSGAWGALLYQVLWHHGLGIVALLLGLWGGRFLFST